LGYSDTVFLLSTSNTLDYRIHLQLPLWIPFLYSLNQGDKVFVVRLTNTLRRGTFSTLLHIRLVLTRHKSSQCFCKTGKGHWKQFIECATTSVVVKTVLPKSTKYCGCRTRRDKEIWLKRWFVQEFPCRRPIFCYCVFMLDKVGESWDQYSKVITAGVSEKSTTLLRRQGHICSAISKYVYPPTTVLIPEHLWGIGCLFALDSGILKECRWIPRIGTCIISPSIGRDYPSNFKGSIVVDQI
jgi:hypothetical protein